jgi:Mg2+ and Co2+ transporter CorA
VLRDVFGFHPLAVEDTLSAESRVRVEEYEDAYLFAIVRGVAFPGRDAGPVRPGHAEPLLLPGSQLSRHRPRRPGARREPVRTHIARTPRPHGRGVARVAHLVMDDAVDAYFPVLDGIDGFFDAMEPRVFEAFDDRALPDMFQLERLVLLAAALPGPAARGVQPAGPPSHRPDRPRGPGPTRRRGRPLCAAAPGIVVRRPRRTRQAPRRSAARAGRRSGPARRRPDGGPTPA